MSAVATTEVSWGTAMTVADLDALPDDGRRHELLDGTLIVTPAPSWGHQRAQMRLLRHLLPLVPADHELLVAPLDVRISDTTNLQPDILIARIADMTEANLPTAPVLVVEVVSPSTRRIDLTLKKSTYEELGTPHYWVVDPREPSMTAWELVEGRYVEAGHAVGADELVLERPFPLRVVPEGLVS